MKPQECKTFDDLTKYLQTFSNFHGDPVPYDFVGAFVLFDAILENLSTKHFDVQLEDLAESYPLSAEKVAFLNRLLQFKQG